MFVKIREQLLTFYFIVQNIIRKTVCFHVSFYSGKNTRSTSGWTEGDKPFCVIVTEQPITRLPQFLRDLFILSGRKPDELSTCVEQAMKVNVPFKVICFLRNEAISSTHLIVAWLQGRNYSIMWRIVITLN